MQRWAFSIPTLDLHTLNREMLAQGDTTDQPIGATIRCRDARGQEGSLGVGLGDKGMPLVRLRQNARLQRSRGPELASNVLCGSLLGTSAPALVQ